MNKWMSQLSSLKWQAGTIVTKQAIYEWTYLSLQLADEANKELLRKLFGDEGPLIFFLTIQPTSHVRLFWFIDGQHPWRLATSSLGRSSVLSIDTLHNHLEVLLKEKNWKPFGVQLLPLKPLQATM